MPSGLLLACPLSDMPVYALVYSLLTLAIVCCMIMMYFTYMRTRTPLDTHLHCCIDVVFNRTFLCCACSVLTHFFIDSTSISLYNTYCSHLSTYNKHFVHAPCLHRSGPLYMCRFPIGLVFCRCILTPIDIGFVRCAYTHHISHPNINIVIF